jgi:uncharacterized protein YndB with AHSA1/START domain
MVKRVYAEIPVRETAARVYQAWVSADELRSWFVEQADVSIEAGTYLFWGRYQPDAPQRDAVNQQILVAEPGQRLRFDWRVAGVETTVDVRIDQRPAATRVVVEHEWIPESDAAIIEAFWSLSLENLRGWLERGEAGARCDFTVVPLEEIRLSIDVNADPEAVFRALVDPAQLDRYIASSASIEPEVGGRYDFGWAEHGPMRILELEPGRRFAYTWNYEGDDHAANTVVTWTLEGGSGKTRLTMVHSGFSKKRGANDYQIGWLDFMNRIKFMVETGPDWIKPNTHGMYRDDEPIAASTYAAPASQ